MTDLNLVVTEKTTELFLSVLTCVPRKMTAFLVDVLVVDGLILLVLISL